MEHLKMQTADMADRNIEQIGALFPECLTERINSNGRVEQAIDFDKLRQLLAHDVVEGPEQRYQFTWPDKRAAIRLANTPTSKTLRPCRAESVDFDTTQNLYIEGDNLDVLKLLRENYLGKVKMIYIDPPYNTGNDFVYNDDFAQGKTDFEQRSGLFDEEGHQTIDPMQRNTEANGRFHTDWLNMIYPRLKVARDLLSDDGVIFISIDDNEVDNLKKVCNEIYGEDNFVAQIVWEQGRKSIAVQVAINHEYCLIYCKNRNANIEADKKRPNRNWQIKKRGLELIYQTYDRLKKQYGDDYASIEAELKKFYKDLPDDNPAKAHSHYRNVDEYLGIYHPDNISQGTGQGGRFDIIHPVTHKPCKVPAGGWRFSQSKLPELLANHRIVFGKDETTVPCLKRYLCETEYEVYPSIFYKDGRGASKRLTALFGGKYFDFPKDEEIIKTFVQLVTSYENSDSLVLDFFSGSATTAHAVMQLNAEDGGNRKFIMVQLPEKTDPKSEAYKAGYPNICEIGKERIRRAGKKIKEELAQKAATVYNKLYDMCGGAIDSTNPSAIKYWCEKASDDQKRELVALVREYQELNNRIKIFDTGFRVLKLDSSNMADVYYTPAQTPIEQTLGFEAFEDNIKPDRTAEDLLFQVMPECNLPLSSRIEEREIHGKKVYAVDDNYLVACFDRDIDEQVITEIARMQPYYFVMRDASAATDNVLDNFDQIFNAYSKETIRRIL